MSKNRYEAPAICTFKIEPYHLMDNSPDHAAGTVYDENGNVVSQGDFQSGGDAPSGGDPMTSDSKHGNYNPWTAWDNLPAWE